MRVLFSTYSAAFQNPGGGEQIILALQERLKKRGHQVDFFGSSTTPLSELKRYDLIHSFSCVEPEFWSVLKGHAPSIPLVVTPTLYIAPGWKTKLGYQRRNLKWRILGQRSPYSYPDLWLPCTPVEARSLSTHLNVEARKVRVIPNGIEQHFAQANPLLFPALLSAQTKFAANTPFLLHVGRFHPVKNHLNLIEAVRLARAQMVFVGGAAPEVQDQSYYKECVQRARAAEEADSTGQTRFFFLPPFEHSDPLLASAYASCALFVLPSLFETFGLSAFEAALAGAPLLLTDQMVTRPVLQAWATFVAPSDPQALAAAIEHRRALGWPRTSPSEREARSHRIGSEFSWEAVTDRVLQAYQSVLV